ncbi:MAG: hypothetical protein KF819_06265 [Labilithrix sp.]|nr:hypothetical protein [Labilithrix sp.]
MAEPMIKGAAIRELFAWYEETRGKGRVREAVRRVPEDLRPLLDPDEPRVTLLPASWYPCRLVHSMLESLKEGMSDAEFDALLREGTRAVILRGIAAYRFVLEKIVTPEIYALMVPRFWRQLHSTGVRRMKIVGPNEARSVTAKWPGHHPLLCTLTIETMCALFERMGKRDLQWERVKCVSSDGGDECVTRLTWK